MQHPVGSTVTDGRAELTNVWELFSNRFAIWAYIHVLLVGLTTAAVVIFGVACWHLVRGRNQELFRQAAKLALIVGVPISALNLGVGSQMGVVVTDYQPMKIAATEAQWDTCQPCAFSLFQIGGFTEDDQTPTFSIQIPHLLSFLATLFLGRRGAGAEPAPGSRTSASTARGELHPAGADDVLVHAGHGLRRHARLPRARARGVPLLAREARVDALVPLARRPDDPAPVRSRRSPAGCSPRSGASRGSCGAC